MTYELLIHDRYSQISSCDSECGREKTAAQLSGRKAITWFNTACISVGLFINRSPVEAFCVSTLKRVNVRTDMASITEYIKASNTDGSQEIKDKLQELIRL